MRNFFAGAAFNYFIKGITYAELTLQPTEGLLPSFVSKWIASNPA